MLLKKIKYVFIYVFYNCLLNNGAMPSILLGSEDTFWSIDLFALQPEQVNLPVPQVPHLENMPAHPYGLARND